MLGSCPVPGIDTQLTKMLGGPCAVTGGLRTRALVSAQLTDLRMPSRLRSSFGHKFEELEVARSEALQQHWLLRRLHIYTWRTDMYRKYQVLKKEGKFRVWLCYYHVHTWHNTNPLHELQLCGGCLPAALWL